MGYTDDKTSEGARGGSIYAGRNFRVVGAPFIKKDAKALVTGKPVFTHDLALKECLVGMVLRSPYAHAMVREIDCGVAAKVPGIECFLTWKDVPQSRFTMAGQTYPEPSPYDRLILDRRLSGGSSHRGWLCEGGEYLVHDLYEQGLKRDERPHSIARGQSCKGCGG